MDKTIIIQGKQNRYQMKKVLRQQESLERKLIIDDNFLNYEFQKKSLVEENGCYQIMRKYINKKIESYKYQDHLKNRKTEDFIIIDDVIKMLNPMKCFYCDENVFILYKLKLEPKQWTLDRIENDLGHEKGNVVLSCLKCNLERRCKNKDSFEYTKKLKIVKMD
jgi:hypothetical protein